MSGIFISYRRGDTAAEAGRLADHLRERFGADQIFIDVEAIEPGQDFVVAIQRALDACAVVIVMIGDRWLSTVDDQGRRRLDDPQDFVHQEVGAALKRGDVRVIPVLVQRATMPGGSELPAPLADLGRRNALEIRETHFRRDVDALIEVVARLVPAGTGATVPGGPPAGGRRRRLVVPAVVGGLAIAVLASVVGIRLATHRPVPPPAHDNTVKPLPGPSALGLKLQVQLDPQFGAVGPLPNMTLWHRKPGTRRNPEYLQAQNGIYETDPIPLPAKGDEFLGELRRATTDPSFQRDPARGVTRVCIERKVDSLQGRDPAVWLRCQEGGQCEIDRDDPGWAGLCKTSTGGADPRGWVERAHAQTGPAPQEPGWVVPSLQTLRKIAGTKEGIGYTEFTLRTDPIPSLRQADNVTYAIRVHGTPVYIDGWPPDAWRAPFDAAQGLRLEFALANLDFSGQDQGREDVDVVLEFARGKQVLRTEKVRLPYVALRPACGKTVNLADGLSLRWQASYVGAQPGDRWQILVASMPEGRAAEDHKKKIDGARLRLDGSEVVGVIRPPLPPRNDYGIALGLRQPSGQVKFTFDDATAQRLFADTKKLAPTTRGVISPSTFLREVDRIPAKPCPDA